MSEKEPIWIDSHAHLDSPDLLAELDDVLLRARQAGVGRIQTIGCVAHTPDVCSSVIGLAESHEAVFAALGVHPHDARAFDTAAEKEILAAMDHPRVLAWGEIGLDYFYDNSPRDVQIGVFRRQIECALSVKKPIIVHTRDAEDDTLSLLEDMYSDAAGPRGVLHCFTGTWQMAQRCLDLGFYLGFGGMLTFKKAENVRECARKAPLDRLLVETDSPYLAPAPHRGKRNEPAFVALAGEELARLRGLPESEMAALTCDNFERLFTTART